MDVMPEERYLDTDRPFQPAAFDGPWNVIGAIALAGVAASAYGSYSQSQNAKKIAKAGQKGYTDQTTTQTPYGNEFFQDPGGGDVRNIMERQRAIIDQGPTYIGGRGSGAPGGGSRQAPAAGQRYNKAGKLVTAKNATPIGGSAASGPATPNYKDPNAISAAVAQAGLNAGNDPTTQAAQLGVRNILSGQGGANSGTGYQGFNPINDRLAQHLQGNVEGDDASDLVHQFLGAGGAGGSQGGGWDPYSEGGGSGGGGGFRGSSASAAAADRQMVAGGGPADSTATPGLFNGTVRRLLAQGTDQETIQQIIDAQNADVTRGMQRNLWDLDAQSQGTGRLGGDTWKGLYNDTERNAASEMAQYSGQTRLGANAQQNALYESLLGQVNARDLGAMNDATQRYGISSSASSAAAGNASAAELARRGQNLQALGMLMDDRQFNTGQLSGLGNALTQAQLGAIGEAPGLAGIANAGLGQANNAAGNEVALRQAQISGGNARAALNQQAQIYNANAAQSQLNDYLRTVMGIGSLGGSTHTEGSNVQPINYTGSSTGAAIGSGLGTAATIAGLYNQYQANQNQRPPAQGYDVTGASGGVTTGWR